MATAVVISAGLFFTCIALNLFPLPVSIFTYATLTSPTTSN